MIKSINRTTFSIYTLITVLTAYSLLIVFTQNYERLTADSTIYLDLAEKYLRGDYKNAVNGYWGPLLAWLFIPFLYFNSSPLFAINCLKLIVGLLTIIGVWFLSFRFDISEKIRGAVILSLLPMMLFFTLIEIFDILLLCFITYYLSIIFNSDYHNKVSRGIFCGILGALAYFSKSYAFPFFVLHFLVMNVLHFIRSSSKLEKMNVLRNAIAGFTVFVLIITPWVAAISMKYDRLTFSNQAKGNFAPIGPDDPKEGLERGVIIFHKGLFAPTNNTATSVWEDPSYIWEDIEAWNPFESVKHFRHFIKNIIQNMFDVLDIFEQYSNLSIAIFIAYILILMAGPINIQVLRANSLFTIITILIYTAGYLPFHLEHRYLWTVNILLLLMGGNVLTVIFQNAFFSKKLLQNILIALFALSFMFTPLRNYVRAGNYNINKNMYTLSAELENKYQIHGNIASNREWEHVPIHDSWHKTFLLSYWLNSRYYGQTQAVITDDELQKELKKHDIDYYFIWGKSQHIPLFLSDYKELTNGEIDNLRIYSLKEKLN